MPEAARALMRGLLCGREARLGRGGAPDFRPLGLFAGLDWDGLRGSTPPFAPGCGAATDTSNFDVLDERLTPAVSLPLPGGPGGQDGPVPSHRAGDGGGTARQGHSGAVGQARAAMCTGQGCGWQAGEGLRARGGGSRRA